MRAVATAACDRSNSLAAVSTSRRRAVVRSSMARVLETTCEASIVSKARSKSISRSRSAAIALSRVPTSLAQRESKLECSISSRYFCSRPTKSVSSRSINAHRSRAEVYPPRQRIAIARAAVSAWRAVATPEASELIRCRASAMPDSKSCAVRVAAHSGQRASWSPSRSPCSSSKASDAPVSSVRSSRASACSAWTTATSASFLTAVALVRASSVACRCRRASGALNLWRVAATPRPYSTASLSCASFARRSTSAARPAEIRETRSDGALGTASAMVRTAASISPEWDAKVCASDNRER